MPIYDYRCPNGHTFNKLVSKVTDEKQPCPECGQPSDQQMSVPSPFQWSSKTGGWN